jgi:transposase-like protein
LSVDDYCEGHGLSRNQYYYWLRKVKARFLEAAPQLVELHVPETVPAVRKPMPINPAVTADVPQLLISKGTLEREHFSNL